MKAMTYEFIEIKRNKPLPHSEFMFIIWNENGERFIERFDELSDDQAFRNVADKKRQLIADGYEEV